MKGKATFKLSGLRAKHWRSAAHMKGAEMIGTPMMGNKRHRGKSGGGKQWTRADKLWGRTDSW